MTHSRLTLLGLILVALVLTACGGNTRQGVTLEPVQVESVNGAAAAATPTPEPQISGLTGRLIYLKGTLFESLDLATGQTTRYESPAALSPLMLNAPRTHGVFVAQSRFVVINLLDNSVLETQNLSNNANNLRVSPDGKWIAAAVGQISARLLMISLPEMELYTVAAGSGAIYDWSWSTDSRLVWWDYAVTPLETMIYDPVNRSSTPLTDNTVELTVPFPLQLSPDGQHVASVPIAYGPPPGQEASDDSCFDSYVELYDSSYRASAFNTRGSVIWTENGLVASSPQWLNNDQLLFIKVGTGACGNVTGEPVRQIMQLDITASGTPPRILAEPLGNSDDFQDRMQRYAKSYTHLYSPSPDGQFIAWVSGSQDAGISEVKITNVNTGETQIVLHWEYGDARDAVDFLENYFVRQVIWLE